MHIKRKTTKILIISLFLILFPNFISKDNLKIIYNNTPNKIKNITYNKKEEYLFVLNIPKINLSKKVYPLESKLNDINKNVKILSSSNIKNNLFILASHSGTNFNAYFNNLYLLKTTDLIYIDYQNTIYTYQVKDISYINKTGYLEIPKYLDNTLILITCSRKYINKQIIVSSTLVNKKQY